MSRLLKHVQHQHTLSVKLDGVLEGLLELNNAELAENAQSALIHVAYDLAAALSDNLDSAALPREREA